jgi:hypothetical protein
MKGRWRILAGLLGLGFALQGVAWLVSPVAAAGGLGMPLLDGLGRSTQIGDFAAFFLALGLTALAGASLDRARLLYFPAALLVLAAAGRTIAWAAHGADFAAVFIPVEIAAAAAFIAAARSLPQRDPAVLGGGGSR